MTIKEKAAELQILIDEQLELFATLGKEAKKLREKLDKIHLKMADILQELKPVDALIRAQHPEKGQLFDALLEHAKEEESTTLD